MALMDILVRLDHTEAGLLRLKIAADLAERNHSRLTGLYVRDRGVADLTALASAEMGLAPAKAMAALKLTLNQSLDERTQKTRLRFEQLLRELNILGEWKCHKGHADNLTAYHARYSDICIIGRGLLTDDRLPLFQESTQRIIFLSGRPVLIVPSESRVTSVGRRIIVGWDASRAATRAVNDALPLIVGAELTTIVTVNPQIGEHHHGEEPGANIAQHLGRHGAVIRTLKISTPGEAASALLQEADKSDADLIVAGCYGHSWIGEQIFGGNTVNLLTQNKFPVLMSY
jgi:nucleotide-binding universal stress UspA family protein